MMPQLTKDQRVWICIEFARTNNAHEVARRWVNRIQGNTREYKSQQ